MLVYVSLRQLLLYQMGYLLFNELNQNNKSNENIMERLKILQTAFEQLKSYQHNHHFHEMLSNFEFEIEEDELKELQKLDDQLHETPNINDEDSLSYNSWPNSPTNEQLQQNKSREETQYLHPFGFGMWLQEQTFINLGLTGTMDDSETTKQFWRQLTGNTFIKMWKKQKISKQNIIEHYNTNSEDNSSPYIDISIDGNSVVKARQFRLSLCRNRIFEIKIPDPEPPPVLASRPSISTLPQKQTNERKSRRSVDHGINPNYDINNDINNINSNHSKSPFNISSPRAKNGINNRNNSSAQSISGVNLFNTIINQHTLRITCCILLEPKLAMAVLKEFIIDPQFDLNGRHKAVEIKEAAPMDSLQPTPTPLNQYSSGSFDGDETAFGYNSLQLPMVGAQLIFQQQSSLSVASSPAPPSICSQGRFSNISANTSYTGIGFGNADSDMSADDIYKYLMEMDYSDKKNPVKYEWKLMVDALNAFQFKVVSIDDYTDDDILKMINRTEEGLVNSVHDQRSGLIKVACHLFVLIAQYRTPLFFDEEFFKHWMLVFLRKCANRDKIRTLPAHNACRDIVACILSYYVNNKDNSKEFLLSKLKDMFIIFASLWTPNNMDITWMKQMKSVTQFIKNITLMIKHTAILHQAPPNNIDTMINFNLDEDKSVNNDDEKDKIQDQENIKPIENEDIKAMQEVAFDLFKQFTKQSHKEARDCAIELLINLYKLEKERTFEFAKNHFVKRELIDYLKKLKKIEILSDEHQKELESLSSRGTRTRIRKGIKKKKGKTKSLNDKDGKRSMKSQIKQLKKQKKSKSSKSARSVQKSTIPEDESTDKEVTNTQISKITNNKSKPEIIITKVPSLDHDRNSINLLNTKQIQNMRDGNENILNNSINSELSV